jgi:DNA-binding MarR family transcriptional regulator
MRILERTTTCPEATLEKAGRQREPATIRQHCSIYCRFCAFPEEFAGFFFPARPFLSLFTRKRSRDMNTAPKTKARAKVSKPKGAGILKLEDNLSYRLSILNFLMSRVANRIYGAEGLTSQQWRVLSILYYSGPLSASDITKWVALDKAAISRAVSQLMKLGLAERALRGQAEDARIVDVTASKEGCRLYVKMARQMAAFQADLLADFDEEQVRTLFALIDQLETKLRAEPQLE